MLKGLALQEGKYCIHFTKNVIYNPILCYRLFYDTVYSRAISTNFRHFLI